jgi:hypothetical protein
MVGKQQQRKSGAKAVGEWLRENPDAWHGWPTRSLFEQADHGRLKKLVKAMTPLRVVLWFGEKSMDAHRLFAELATEIADVRLKRRRAYEQATARHPW